VFRLSIRPHQRQSAEPFSVEMPYWWEEILLNGCASAFTQKLDSLAFFSAR
jgi:hypothetical protein